MPSFTPTNTNTNTNNNTNITPIIQYIMYDGDLSDTITSGQDL